MLISIKVKYNIFQMDSNTAKNIKMSFTIIIMLPYGEIKVEAIESQEG